MQPLEPTERQALEQIIKDPMYASAIKKVFANREDYFTKSAKLNLNVIPETLHAKVKQDALAKHAAAMAKAYGQAWSDIEKAAKE